MSYYRPSPLRVVWGVAIAAALLLALWLATRATVGAIRRDERAQVLREGDTLLGLMMDRAAELQRERDALRAVVGRVDTVLVTRIRRVRDTAWLPADTSPVVRLAACRAALDTLATDCDSFRQAATTALAQADSIHRHEAAAIVTLAQQLAAVRRADSVMATSVTRASRWRTVARGICAGSVAAHVLTLARQP